MTTKKDLPMPLSEYMLTNMFKYMRNVTVLKSFPNGMYNKRLEMDFEDVAILDAHGLQGLFAEYEKYVDDHFKL